MAKIIGGVTATPTPAPDWDKMINKPFDDFEEAVRAVGDGYYALASDVGDIDAALDAILAMQESLIGGDA